MILNRSENIHLRIAAAIFFVLCWHAVVILARSFFPHLNVGSLPTPVETVYAMVNALKGSGNGPLYQFSILLHSAASLLRVVEGFLLSLVIGIPLGIWMGWSRKVSCFVGTIVEILRPIPPIAWIPVALLLFGFNAPIFIVFIGIVFPIILNTIQGVSSVDKNIVDVARILGAEKGDMLFKVVLPSSFPYMVTGMRVGVGVGWMCIVAAEMVGMRGGLGLGYFVWLAYDLYNIPAMVAGMVFIGFVGWVMNEILEQVEHRLMRWRE